jgi:hypothetical protein
MSAYWTPAMYHITPNNTFVNLLTNGTAVYWFGITGENETLSEMPGGLRKDTLIVAASLYSCDVHLLQASPPAHPLETRATMSSSNTSPLRATGGTAPWRPFPKVATSSGLLSSFLPAWVDCRLRLGCEILTFTRFLVSGTVTRYCKTLRAQTDRSY